MARFLNIFGPETGTLSKKSDAIAAAEQPWTTSGRTVKNNTKAALDETVQGLKDKLEQSYKDRKKDLSFIENLRSSLHEGLWKTEEQFKEKDLQLRKDLVKKKLDAEVPEKVAELDKKLVDIAKDIMNGTTSIFGGKGGVKDRKASNEPDIATIDENGDVHPAENNTESEDEYVEFSYKPGDTFGQKIIDLGIGTDKGLWGDDGDVAYYTQQLVDGGYLDANGNVKLGVPIRLKKRK